MWQALLTRKVRLSPTKVASIVVMWVDGALLAHQPMSQVWGGHGQLPGQP